MINLDAIVQKVQERAKKEKSCLKELIDEEVKAALKKEEGEEN